MSDTPLEITGKYCHGITYPCNKERAMEVMSSNGAPSAVIEQLRTSTYERFTQQSEILAALWHETKGNPFRGDTKGKSPYARRGTAAER
ncbi:MAG: hypothetical protein AVDCRST_MAG53-2920 [uncultured Solirubrobacteraceae bacterium]|uniref:DUF2795 domain-containing protein n=1 Tax=uncultured Solirubrobacteraceae bacterium TaxID=1162706 RepID=A0A6J4T5B0_9ACTN|nr:MAG: hypothetical protein AVDCRST_MAG53-2920 [uncultured Solirubrobacteraceae bacterium]